MEKVAELDLEESVETAGTNWEFSGTANGPAWTNRQTNHRLIIDESDTDGFSFRVRLNHTSQARPWWTVTEVGDFTAELIPIVEWVVSAPDDDFYTRELVATMLDPFWDQDDTPRQQDAVSGADEDTSSPPV
jgi:hypothetical protein